MTFPHLVLLPKATVLVGVHPVHMSSKCPGWDWEAVGGAWRKERVERETRMERRLEEKEGRETRKCREMRGRCVCIRWLNKKRNTHIYSGMCTFIWRSVLMQFDILE